MLKALPTTFVLVLWDDAHADFDTVTLDDAHVKHRPELMVTAGWLIRQDSEGISLAAEFCPSDSTYRARSFIPGVLVKDIIPVRLPKSRPRNAQPLDLSPRHE